MMEETVLSYSESGHLTGCDCSCCREECRKQEAVIDHHITNLLTSQHALEEPSGNGNGRSELVRMVPPDGLSIRKHGQPPCCHVEASPALRSQLLILHTAASCVIKSLERIGEKNNLGNKKYQ